MAQNPFDLTGRAALVTGGSKGLGKAMARGLAQAGADVVISGRRAEALQTAAREIGEGLSANVHHIVADMTNRTDVARLAREAVEALGRVDILINNAGGNVPQPIDQIDDEVWDELVELNLTSCMALSRALALGMKARRWGRIIHVSSIMAISSTAGRDAYSATKSALMGLARAGANDLGEYGVTVNCLAPGSILTELPQSLLSEARQAELASRTALGRWGRPDEIVGPILLLASEAGSYITGSTLVVDGGALAKRF